MKLLVSFGIWRVWLETNSYEYIVQLRHCSKYRILCKIYQPIYHFGGFVYMTWKHVLANLSNILSNILPFDIKILHLEQNRYPIFRTLSWKVYACNGVCLLGERSGTCGICLDWMNRFIKSCKTICVCKSSCLFILVHACI